LTARTIRKFRIGPSLRIESRIGRTIRNRIESRSFAGPYFIHHFTLFIAGCRHVLSENYMTSKIGDWVLFLNERVHGTVSVSE